MELNVIPKKWTALEVESIVSEKLVSARITLTDTLPKASGIEDVLKIPNSIKDELLSRHRRTIVSFWKFCYPSLQNEFIDNIDQELFFKSPDYILLCNISAGYVKGLLALDDAKPDHPEIEYLLKTIPGLFSKEEFAGIQETVKDLLIYFPDNVSKAKKWITEYVAPEKKQVDALADFVEIFKKGVPDRNDIQFKKASENLLNSGIMEPGPHSLLWLQQRKKAGLMSPFEQLILNIERIFLYLEVLSYAGFSSYSISGPENLEFFHVGHLK